MKWKGFSHKVLMIRPANFGYNVETAVNNEFQTKPSLSERAIAKTAVEEFDGFVRTLRSAGIEVIVWQDDGEKVRPDAVFPNNWIGFHEGGLMVTYPMYAENRRWERSPDLMRMMEEKWGFTSVISLEEYEKSAKFLEGTGSMVLDREHRVCYSCLSPRTHLELLEKWCTLMEYELCTFTAVGKDGRPIYHTNVMMSIGPDIAVVCLDSLSDEGEKRMLQDKLGDAQKEILAITHDQMSDYAGNVLFVEDREGRSLVVVSARAWQSLDRKQRFQLEDHADVVLGEISTIEKIGGGSVRCMLAEVF